MSTPRLRRLQWAVRATLALGVAASVTANVLHARDNPISQAIAAWPPLALLITVELVSRIPIVHRWLGVVRVVSTAAIAGIAAWVSYWHMASVVARYGETGTVPYLLPLSVDGLIIVASVSLVELAARLRDTTPGPAAASATSTTPTSAPGTGPAAHRALTGDSPAAQAPADQRSAVPAAPPPVTDPATGAVGSDARPEPSPARHGVDDSHRADAEDPDDEDDLDDDADQDDEGPDGIDLAPDLVPLLPAARTARDELVREGRTVSRDALAHRLRRNGHAIRNNRVSELLNALRREQRSLNGAHPTVPL